MSFKTGDIVHLKSGSPDLLVIRVIGETENNRMDSALRMRGYEDEDVLCEWDSVETKSKQRKAFKVAMLVSPSGGSEDEEE